MGTDSNCLVFRNGGYVERPRTWGGIDPTGTASIAVYVAQEKRAVKVMVDSIGVRAALPSTMNGQGVPSVGVKTSERATEGVETGEFNRLRDQL